MWCNDWCRFCPEGTNNSTTSVTILLSGNCCNVIPCFYLTQIPFWGRFVFGFWRSAPVVTCSGNRGLAEADIDASKAQCFSASWSLKKASPKVQLLKHSTPNMTGRRFHCTVEVIPRRPWKSKSPFASSPFWRSRKHKDGKGAHEVRQGTSTIHFHRTVPCSSSHTGPQSMISAFTQQATNPPEFARPGLSRSTGNLPQREGTNLGVFIPVWLVWSRCGALSSSFRWVASSPLQYPAQSLRRFKKPLCLLSRKLLQFFWICLGIWHWKMALETKNDKNDKSLKNSEDIRSNFRRKIRVENSKNSGTSRSAPSLT